jgi:phosphomannomutase
MSSDVGRGVAEPPIVFGTNGWRGVRGAAFTLARVRLAARAVGRFLSETGPAPEVVVARDTRAGGDAFLAAAVRELVAEGMAVTVARGAVPTPAAVHAMRTRGAAAAIVFTASHNPPEYSGMKVFGAWGGVLPTVATQRIEALAAEFASAAQPL